MQLDETFRLNLISKRMDQAYEVMEVADIMISHGKLDSAARYILYGANSSVEALSLKYNQPTDNQNMMIRWFHNSIIKNGHMDKEYGQILRHLHKVNLRSDYDKFTRFEKDNISELLMTMMKFVIEVDYHINNL